MKQGWNDYENAANRGPVSFAMKCLAGLFVIALAIWGISAAFSVLNSAGRVANELSPAEIQAKYEWFKDASAQLDALQANISANEARKTAIEKRNTVDGKVLPPREWTRADQDAIVQIDAETAGIKMTYNRLAAEYNAQMAKWNWRFTNLGDLPQGATKVLPRDYKPYEN